MVTVVRRRGLARAVQSGKLGGADLLGAGGAGGTPWVLRPPLLRGAAAGGQEALCHGCSALLRPLAAGGITSHLPGTTHTAMDKEVQWMEILGGNAYILYMADICSTIESVGDPGLYQGGLQSRKICIKAMQGRKSLKEVFCIKSYLWLLYAQGKLLARSQQ